MNHGQINGVNIFKFKYLGQPFQCAGDTGGGGTLALKPFFETCFGQNYTPL